MRGKKLRGPTGGVQGYEGTMFGFKYKPGGVVDRIVEAFSGSHDMIGGSWSGLYDEQGNMVRDRNAAQKLLHGASTVSAIPVAAPFAASELPRPVWNAIGTFLKMGR